LAPKTIPTSSALRSRWEWIERFLPLLFRLKRQRASGTQRQQVRETFAVGTLIGSQNHPFQFTARVPFNPLAINGFGVRWRHLATHDARRLRCRVASTAFCSIGRTNPGSLVGTDAEVSALANWVSSFVRIRRDARFHGCHDRGNRFLAVCCAIGAVLGLDCHGSGGLTSQCNPARYPRLRRLGPYIRLALASRSPLLARLVLNALWVAQEAVRKRPPVWVSFGLNGGGDADRVTSRSDDHVRGPIRSDDPGRRGPCDRDHGRGRPSQARRHHWRRWQGRWPEPAASPMPPSPRLQIPRRQNLLS
jgi:hypothetical protein